jgi:hypothetical protein
MIESRIVASDSTAVRTVAEVTLQTAHSSVTFPNSEFGVELSFRKKVA